MLVWLEQMRLFRANAQVMQLHLRLGPGQRQSALERPGIPILVREVQHLLSRGSDDGRENQMRRGSRRDVDRAAQTERGIQH